MIHQSIQTIVGARAPATIAPDETVRAACHKLVTAIEGAVAVMKDGRLVGIIEDHDIIERAICQNRPTKETLVRDIMTPSPRSVGLTASLAEAMTIMVEQRIRHLPVLNEETLVGILSMRDIPTQYRLLVERFREFQENGRNRDSQLTLLV